MSRDPILISTKAGLYCPDGDFHIDPMGRVPRALITHGHSDHAARGMGAYLCTAAALPVIRHRLGKINAEGIAYGEPRRIGGVTVSFHPAGHVPGSAQIRIERDGEVWVASGDYKTAADGLCEAFEPVQCHTFLSECTFGLPVFRWQPEATVLDEIARWWRANAAEGRASVLLAYSFGKAQRLMAGLQGLGPICTHPVVEEVTAILRAQGYGLPPTLALNDTPAPKGALVIASPNAMASGWALGLGPHVTAAASGWMALAARRKGTAAAFTLSDHADWPGLNAAVAATGAARVLTMHGYTRPFSQWLASRGLQSEVIR
ncbi:ligase-associated DNA damage response exonuclease [bacterium]|nr:ligase-associated DNA damage response exonuclease [bacterium]